MKSKDFKIGDRVQFDLENVERSPAGYGYVSRVSDFGIMIQPDRPLIAGARMVNITKVENSK